MIGFYDPYLKTLGGGEKYLLSMLEVAVAARQPVRLISPEPPRVADWRRLGLRIPRRDFDWQPGDDQSLTKLSTGLDRLVVLHNSIPPRSQAAHSLAVIQFPFVGLAKRRPWSIRLRRQQQAALASYDRFVCYSEFVRVNLARRWGVSATVIAPPVDPAKPPRGPRRPWIVAVGRFFRGGHNKKHDVMIGALAELRRQLPADSPWQLHLAGGVADDADAAGYLAELRNLAKGLPVYFHPNLSLPALDKLYGQSSLFWHAAGYGEDERRHPERSEHFGITTVEAMFRGCLPVVIAKGGQPEIVSDGVNGLLWQTPAELVSQTKSLIDNPKRLARLARRATADAQRYSKDRFRQAVGKLILPSQTT